MPKVKGGALSRKNLRTESYIEILVEVGLTFEWFSLSQITKSYFIVTRSLNMTEVKERLFMKEENLVHCDCRPHQ